jgi:Asp-tRNA(Asn)/Glu-tRNA(Gln) amidotransferase A subunit family amidase
MSEHWQLGALDGVPITVKEDIDLAGTPTTHAVADLGAARVRARRRSRRCGGRHARHAAPVLPANVFSLPAAVVPCGTTDGLPVGAQVMGDRFTDLRCLAIAQQFQSSVGAPVPIDPVVA